MKLHAKCAAAFAAAAIALGVGSYKAFDSVEGKKQTVETVAEVVDGQPIKRLEREHTAESATLLSFGWLGAAGSLVSGVVAGVSGYRFRRRAKGGRTYQEMREEALNQPEPRGQN